MLGIYFVPGRNLGAMDTANNTNQSPHPQGPDILLQWDVLSKHELAIDISSLLIWQEK